MSVRWFVAGALVAGLGVTAWGALRQPDGPRPPPIVSLPPPQPLPFPTAPILPAPVETPRPIERPRPAAHWGSARVLHRAPVHISTEPSSEQVAHLYVEVGTHLKDHPSDALWSRFRRIRIQDALATQENRSETALRLVEIDRSLTEP